MCSHAGQCAHAGPRARQLNFVYDKFIPLFKVSAAKVVAAGGDAQSGTANVTATDRLLSCIGASGLQFLELAVGARKIWQPGPYTLAEACERNYGTNLCPTGTHTRTCRRRPMLMVDRRLSPLRGRSLSARCRL